MLKFFRGIRRKLIDEENLRKYLLYAVGEILLVMIGILLALQVNNWNEQNRKKSQEIAYLKNFKNDLTIDIVNLNQDLAVIEGAKHSMEFLIGYMENDLPWHDSLQYYFGGTTGWWDTEIMLNTFKTLNSNDWNIISNSQLRKDISYYYNVVNGTWSKNQKLYKNALFEISSSVLRTRFDAFGEGNYDDWKLREDSPFKKNRLDPTGLFVKMVPNNFESLKKDSVYLFTLKTLRNKNNYFREMSHGYVKFLSESLIDEIEKELEELK